MLTKRLEKTSAGLDFLGLLAIPSQSVAGADRDTTITGCRRALEGTWAHGPEQAGDPDDHLTGKPATQGHSTPIGTTERKRVYQVKMDRCNLKLGRARARDPAVGVTGRRRPVGWREWGAGGAGSEFLPCG